MCSDARTAAFDLQSLFKTALAVLATGLFLVSSAGALPVISISGNDTGDVTTKDYALSTDTWHLGTVLERQPVTLDHTKRYWKARLGKAFEDGKLTAFAASKNDSFYLEDWLTVSPGTQVWKGWHLSLGIAFSWIISDAVKVSVGAQEIKISKRYSKDKTTLDIVFDDVVGAGESVFIQAKLTYRGDAPFLGIIDAFQHPLAPFEVGAPPSVALVFVGLGAIVWRARTVDNAWSMSPDARPPIMSAPGARQRHGGCRSSGAALRRKTDTFG